MDTIYIALLVYLVFSYLSSMINSRVTKKLNNEKKLELIELFSDTRKHSYLIMIIGFVTCFGIYKGDWLPMSDLMLLFLIFIFVFTLFSSYKTYMKLKLNAFPADYLKGYLNSIGLKMIGLILFLIILFFWK